MFIGHDDEVTFFDRDETCIRLDEKTRDRHELIIDFEDRDLSIHGQIAIDLLDRDPFAAIDHQALRILVGKPHDGPRTTSIN